ncbi:MAG: hypothetical protein MUP82_02005 [Candidatus Marinimicrobia bacterium]|nr:hypothetical protein [Candidatus Neomarinimicrobiota bacterium]
MSSYNIILYFILYYSLYSIGLAQLVRSLEILVGVKNDSLQPAVFSSFSKYSTKLEVDFVWHRGIRAWMKALYDPIKSLNPRFAEK